MTTVPSIQMGFSLTTQGKVINPYTIENIKAMNGTIVRIMEDWSTYNRVPGEYDFMALDGTIEACNKAGLAVVLPIHNPLPDVGFTVPGTGFCKGKNLIIPEEAAKIATVLVTRYKGKRVRFESLNEGAGDGKVDCILNYTADPKGAIAVMQAIYNAVKSVDPGVPVGGPALLKLGQGVPFIEEWVINLLENGAEKCADYLNIHWYLGNPLTASPTFAEVVDAIQGVCEKYNSHLPLKVTEYGFARGKCTPQQQCDYAMEIVREAKKRGGFISGLYYWTASPSDGESPYHGNPPKQVNYPLYTAFQNMKKS